jgi:hypothetical protein
MEITLQIPDELSGTPFGAPSQVALEALAARAYETGVFSVEQVRGMLGLSSRWEAQKMLSRHGVRPGTTVEEILRDAETAAAFHIPAR